MDLREKIWDAAFHLAQDRPVDQISFTDIAERAGVHWTTVRRHVGNKQELRAMLAAQTSQNSSNTDTRTRILDSATYVFAEQGFAGATLDDIAERAGMTKGAVYWHFSSKNDLYLALVERTLSQSLEQLPTQVESILSATDPADALAAFLLSQFRVCTETPEKPMLFFEFITSSREPAIRAKLQETFHNSFEALGNFLQGLQAQGFLNPQVTPKHIAIMIDAIVNGVIRTWLITPETVDFEKLVRDMSQVLWRGLAPQ